jgi:predicted RNA binding protein YcfA (HicA-like mRNA interferase family)
VYVRTTEQGCTTIVVPVHNGRTLKRGTLHGLIDDMGLTREEFIDLL